MRPTATLSLDAAPAAAPRAGDTLTFPLRPRRWEREEPEGLRGTAGLAAVEEIMNRLSCPVPNDLVGEIVREHLGAGGKRLRARLALAALEALRGGRETGVGWAAACELLHNATLIHDDLQDGDRTRRGKAATWARHGPAQAINAGDLLLMLPFLALDELVVPAEVRWTLARLLAGHAAEVVRGQATELALLAEVGCSWESYRAAVVGKTSALFQLPVEGAALLAGLGEEEAGAVAAGFRPLGVLFQLQDDLLDLYGDKGREAPGSDLRGGKVTALVVEHLALHPQDREWLLALLASPRQSTAMAEIQVAAQRFRAGGAVEVVLARVEQEAAEAAASLALRRWPALRALALELVEVVLTPIAHLRGERR